MSQDLIVYGICTAGITACCIGIAYVVAHRQSQAVVQQLRADIRILKRELARKHAISAELRFSMDRRLAAIKERRTAAALKGWNSRRDAA